MCFLNIEKNFLQILAQDPIPIKTIINLQTGVQIVSNKYHFYVLLLLSLTINENMIVHY